MTKWMDPPAGLRDERCRADVEFNRPLFSHHCHLCSAKYSSREALKRHQYEIHQPVYSSQETRMARVALCNVPEPIAEGPTVANRFIISSLRYDEANDRMDFAPRQLYPSADAARKAAYQYLTLGRPMYILEVIEKLELAPPPTVSTDFRAQG